jgi:hypothetical protein
MRNTIYTVVLAAILLSGCTTGSYTFEKGLKEIEAIDARHDTSMYEEQLDRVMLNDWDVEEMLSDLEAMENKLNNMEKTEDIEALLLLIDFRKRMLESEMDMIKVRHIGAKGDIRDSFMCKEREYILNASLLMKSALQKGANALITFDKVTGLAVASDYINRNSIKFDESAVKNLLAKADEGIEIAQEGGFCDSRDEESLK